MAPGGKRGRPKGPGKKAAAAAAAAAQGGGPIPDEFMSLERDAGDPWGPYSAVKQYHHPESQSWKLGMQPHYNFCNIRTITVPEGVEYLLPKYFRGNFEWDTTAQPVDKLEDPAVRAKKKGEWLGSHMPGAKVMFPLRSTGMTYNMLATYCAYLTPGDCAEWQHTDGTSNRSPAALLPTTRRLGYSFDAHVHRIFDAHVHQMSVDPPGRDS